MADQSKSPFAELSFSQQQEQWRVFRARQLEYRQVEEAPPAAPAPPRQQPPLRHSNLDRVREQLAAASRRAGAFQDVAPRA